MDPTPTQQGPYINTSRMKEGHVIWVVNANEGRVTNPTHTECALEMAIRNRSFPSAIHRNGNPIMSVEPTSEPCTEEIPWEDLLYWLGNATTGQVDCSCSKCHCERSQGCVSMVRLSYDSEQDNLSRDLPVYIPSTFYKRLSAMIPVIRLPRIEGIN